MKKYLSVDIHDSAGNYVRSNPLKLSEANLISVISQKLILGCYLIVRLETATKEQYKALFG